jgi:phosphoribosylformylglycinamidine synthase
LGIATGISARSGCAFWKPSAIRNPQSAIGDAKKTGGKRALPPTSQCSIGMKAKIIVTPKKAVLDPQGKTVANALEQMGYKGIGAVHVGKYLEIELPAGDRESWRKQLDAACRKILSNPVIEDYQLEIE